MATMKKIKFKCDLEVPDNNGKILDNTDVAYPTEAKVQELIDEAFAEVVRAENAKF